MKIIEWNTFLNHLSDIKQPAAVTIGVFDGVHIGHAELLNSITQYANKTDSTAMVFTFRFNPKKHTKSGDYRHVQTLRQRLKCFKEAGVQQTVIIDFSKEFSRMDGQEFWNLLLARIDIRHIALGDDFRMGRNGGLDSAGIRSFFAGIQPSPHIAVFPTTRVKGERVSSSRLREAITSGDIPLFTLLTGREYEIETACVRDTYACSDIILPPPGRYLATGVDQEGKIMQKDLHIRLLPNGTVDGSIESFYALQLRKTI